MTEPLKPQEYIIDDTMLMTWRAGCVRYYEYPEATCQKCEFAGKDQRNGCCEFGEDDMQKIFRSRPVAPPTNTPLPNSTDLLLLVHDEWRRREGRKHRHEESAWVSGWLEGFLTSKKYAAEQIVTIHTKQKKGERS